MQLQLKPYCPLGIVVYSAGGGYRKARYSSFGLTASDHSVLSRFPKLQNLTFRI